MRLTRRNFRRSDFPEYHSWFQHPEIAKWLGDIDRDWLEYILSDTSGVEYAFTHQDRLVAVAGIVLPQADHPAAAITNLAVSPELFRWGVGSTVLNLLVHGDHQVDSPSWIAFVARENAAAHSLLTKNGWSRSQEVPVDDMVKYELLLPRRSDA